MLLRVAPFIRSPHFECPLVTPRLFELLYGFLGNAQVAALQKKAVWNIPTNLSAIMQDQGKVDPSTADPDDQCAVCKAVYRHVAARSALLVLGECVLDRLCTGVEYIGIDLRLPIPFASVRYCGGWASSSAPRRWLWTPLTVFAKSCAESAPLLLKRASAPVASPHATFSFSLLSADPLEVFAVLYSP